MISTGLETQQKAAAVIIALGAERASKIYKFLGEDDIERLTFQVTRLQHVTSEETENALDDFYKMCLTQKVVSDGGYEYARMVLEKAFGLQAANNLLDRISNSLKTRAFEFIRKYDSKNLYAIIQHERPQTIALILSYARADQAANIIAELPKSKQIKVVEAIAKMDSTSPETIQSVEEVLLQKFSSIMSMDFDKIGGVDYIADIMNGIDRGNEKYIFEELSKIDSKLSDDIRKRMFVFEDIIALDNMSIQKFLREVETSDLVIALKGTNQDVADKIFVNMSSRMSETIKADLEVTYNVRIRDVEESQQRIVSCIRRLEEEGEIIIAKGGKDDIIA